MKALVCVDFVKYCHYECGINMSIQGRKLKSFFSALLSASEEYSCIEYGFSFIEIFVKSNKIEYCYFEVSNGRV